MFNANILFYFIFLYLCINNIISINFDCLMLNESIETEKSNAFHFLDYFSLKIKNFDLFNEIKINCSKSIDNIEILEIIPNEKIILNNALNLSNLNINFISAPHFYLSNLNGIDLLTNSQFSLLINKFYAIQKLIIISFSNFDIYFNNTIFNDIDCFKFRFRTHFFVEVKSLIIDRYNIFKRKINPLIFYYSKLVNLRINFISNSLIVKNKFDFMDIDSKFCSDLNLRDFHFLGLQISYDILSCKIINKILFKQMKKLEIRGLIYDIEHDLFKYFPEIKSISLNLDKFKQFYHNGNKWFKYLYYNEKNYNLNIKKKLNLNMIILLIHSYNIFSYTYDYPDEDFCLFRDFPHEKLVYPLIDPGYKINCSCTVIWLIQYTQLYFNITKTSEYYKYDFLIAYSDEFRISLAYCFYQNNYQQLKKQCDFQKLSSKCDKINYTTNESTNYINDFDLNSDSDLVILFNLIDFILNIILNPIFAFFGIIFNIFLIYITKNIKNLKKDNFKEMKKINSNMFRHIIINCSFNIAYCFIMIFKPINKCISYTSDFFCSQYYTLIPSQYFDLIVIEYVGSAAKTCCNITYIGLITSRFKLMLNKKCKCLDVKEKTKIILFILFTICFSLGTAVFKLYEYTIDTKDFSNDYNADFPTSKFNYFYCFEDKSGNINYYCNIILC